MHNSFAITSVFIASFLISPFQRPIMALWARVMESDKPVFTLVFSGAAGIAKGLEEIINLL